MRCMVRPAGRGRAGTTELVVAHTAQLPADVLGQCRALLDAAFAADGGFGDEDWDHALGGLHVLLRQGPELVGHAALVTRRLLHGGRAWRTGYVEAVAVRADLRRQGLGGLLMAEVERAAGAAHELAALSTSELGADFYAARGWTAWRGPTSALTPAGVVRTPDEDGGVLVLPSSTPDLDVTGELTCDWRDGDLW